MAVMGRTYTRVDETAPCRSSDAGADGFAEVVGRQRAAEVGGAEAFVEHAVDGALDRGGFVGEGERVAEQERGREDGADRVGQAAAGDVGGRAVDRLVQATAAIAERG